MGPDWVFGVRVSVKEGKRILGAEMEGRKEE